MLEMDQATVSTQMLELDWKTTSIYIWPNLSCILVSSCHPETNEHLGTTLRKNSEYHIRFTSK